MHPENEPLAIDSESGTWWATVLMSDRRKKRIRRVMGNVLATLLTTAAFATLLVLVRFIEC